MRRSSLHLFGFNSAPHWVSAPEPVPLSSLVSTLLLLASGASVTWGHYWWSAGTYFYSLGSCLLGALSGWAGLRVLLGYFLLPPRGLRLHLPSYWVSWLPRPSGVPLWLLGPSDPLVQLGYGPARSVVRCGWRLLSGIGICLTPLAGLMSGFMSELTSGLVGSGNPFAVASAGTVFRLFRQL